MEHSEDDETPNCDASRQTTLSTACSPVDGPFTRSSGAASGRSASDSGARALSAAAAPRRLSEVESVFILTSEGMAGDGDDDDARRGTS